MPTDDGARAVSRRAALRSCAAVAAGVGVALGGLGPGCSRRASTRSKPVVLYSSVDDVFLRPIVAGAERELGLRVLLKGDTEATKTTGLVERLRAEHAAGEASETGVGADVWWSSEPFLTIALAQEGVFRPIPDAVFADLPGPWRGAGALWGGFALRARVVVRREDASAPRGQSGEETLSEAFTAAGPVIARASFGTTRGHFAAVLAGVGEARYAAWLRALRAGGAMVVDGNSAVVRFVASGERPCGLTDTDDVWSGRREGWPVAAAPALIDGAGPLMIPNTVALPARGTNPDGAAALARFIMSEPVERALMDSDSRNMPVRPALMSEMRGGALARFVVEPAGGGPKGPALHEISALAARAVEMARAEGLA